MIDVRSDTVTRPTPAMRQAMATAEVGDDVYGDDPTVNRLQELAATLSGHEASLFVPTGTQSNLIAMLSHCQRGDEYIVGADAHTYKYEGGGAAALGGIQPQTIEFGENGELPLDQVATVIKEDDPHFAKSRLLCLENSQHGRVQSLEYMQIAQAFAKQHGLILHLDGARVCNAAVKLNQSLKSVCECFDSVSICLSKGLGAPVGSILCGNKEFIRTAHRWRKVTGGGMRQAGILAAAGILALTDGYERLHEDHENAVLLDSLLQDVAGCTVKSDWTQTNMVWVEYDDDHSQALPEFAKSRGVLMSVGRNTGRLVIHRDISQEDVATVADVIKAYLQQT
ncbi:MAG: low-specificity L-threonine aldolase [Granulosicoccaceae bacterium]